MEYKTGVLADKRILQNCHLTITNIGIVYHNNGKMVPGLENRNGWRVDKEGTIKWGGVRIKKDYHGGDPWLYPFATEALREKNSQMMENFTICDDIARELEITV